MTKKELWETLMPSEYDFIAETNERVKCACCDYEANRNSLLFIGFKIDLYERCIKYYMCEKCFIKGE